MAAITGWRSYQYAQPEDLATLTAVLAIGALWARNRVGRAISRHAIARAVWIGVGILVLTVLWGVLTVVFGGAAALMPRPFASQPHPTVTG